MRTNDEDRNEGEELGSVISSEQPVPPEAHH
jgi:hypothetical protein